MFRQLVRYPFALIDDAKAMPRTSVRIMRAVNLPLSAGVFDYPWWMASERGKSSTPKLPSIKPLNRSWSSSEWALIRRRCGC